MEGVATESYHEPPEGVLKNKATDNNALASELAYSSVMRTPVCWPGAIVENNGSHLTPKTAGLKVEPYSSQRTPYSVAILSKSKVCDLHHLYNFGLLKLIVKVASLIFLNVDSFKMVQEVKGLELFHHLGGRNLLLRFVASR